MIHLRSYRMHVCSCGKEWPEQVILTESTQNLSGERNAYCPACHKKSFHRLTIRPLPPEIMYEIVDIKPITKGDACKIHMLEERFRAYDTALPQNWVNTMMEVCGTFEISQHFVWVYDEDDCWGRAYPLTKEGLRLLDIWDEEA